MKKIFFSSLAIIFFSIIIYITINSNFRRTILNLSSGLLNNYYSILIRQNLSSEENLSKSIKILENQIKITDMITTNQKNSFIDNIYLNTYAIEKNIKSEKTTPRSVKKACLIPFDMLVSSNIKNKGPNEKDKRKPKGNAAKYSAINLLIF